MHDSESEPADDESESDTIPTLVEHISDDEGSSDEPVAGWSDARRAADDESEISDDEVADAAAGMEPPLTGTMHDRAHMLGVTVRALRKFRRFCLPLTFFVDSVVLGRQP